VHQQVHHAAIKRIDVVSADEMLKAVADNFASADVTIMSAAVADFKPKKVATEKIKKHNQPSVIELQPTTDILAKLGKEKKPHQLLIGFALETENEVENATKKLSNKNLDMIVLNSLRDKGAGFGTDTNKVTLIDRNRKVTEYALKTKAEVAADILEAVAAMA
jgi:phosphopantothenoylcysteine decarboxylase/phosphopantothenate--cysteine ligase